MIMKEYTLEMERIDIQKGPGPFEVTGISGGRKYGVIFGVSILN